MPTHDGLTAKRQLTIERARKRRVKAGVVIPPVPGSGGTDHATLSHLDYASAGHTGFQPQMTTGAPSAVIGLSVVPGTAPLAFMRQDSAPPLSQAIIPTWSKSHAWTPDTDTVPLKINKAAALTSSDLLQVLDTDASLLFNVDNAGLVGINGDPDALLTISGGGAVNTITSGLVGWYKADTLTASLSDGANVVTWNDSSGNGNHLTATGCTLVDGVSAVRPKYNAPSVVPGAKGMPNLPTVSFEGVIAGAMGYFTIDTTRFTLTPAAGWTIAMIIRDYSNLAQDSWLFGANNYGGGGDNGDSFIKNVNAAGSTRFDTSNGGIAKFFCGLYTHAPDGDVNEIVVLRCDTSGAGSSLRAWIDGTLKSDAGSTKNIDHYIRYIGRTLSSVGNPAGVFGKAIAELMIFNVKLSDADVATLNTYLANRRDLTGGATDLTRWKSSGGTTLSRIDPLGQFGFGVTTPLAPLHIVLTTEQQRLAYDSSNYYTTTVGSTGIVTFNAVGAGHSFVFADPVNVTGAIISTSTVFGTNLVGTTNTVPKWTNGAAGIFGNSVITDDGTTVTITTPSVAGRAGSVVTMYGGAGAGLGGVTIVGGNGTDGGAGSAAIVIYGGDGIGTGVPGNIEIEAGSGGTVSDGAILVSESGSGGSVLGDGGPHHIFTGYSSGGVGGPLRLITGDGLTGAGSIRIETGLASGFNGAIEFLSGQYRFYKPGSGTVDGAYNFSGYAGNLNFDAITLDRTYTFFDKSGSIVTITGTPQPQHVMSFENNDTLDPTGLANYVGIYSAIIHSDATETWARALGMVGSVSIQTATLLNATMIVGVTGAVSSSANVAMTGKVMACFSGAMSVDGTLGNNEPANKDITFSKNGHPKGSWDHLTILWCPNLSVADAMGYPTTFFPGLVSSVRATIQDYGAPSTNVSNTTEYWAIYGEHINGSVATFPNVTGYLRMTYPRRTTKTTGGQARAMHAWWEPWPNTSTIRAAAAIGDSYFDDGTNFLKGWHISVVANAYVPVLYTTGNYTSTGPAAGDGGPCTGLFQFDHLQTVTFDDAKNIVVNATTGTKIGTATSQKLGFWNVAPVIQPAAALQAAITNSTGGTQNGTLVDVTTLGLADPAKCNDNFTDIYALLDAMRTALVASGIMKGAA